MNLASRNNSRLWINALTWLVIALGFAPSGFATITLSSYNFSTNNLPTIHADAAEISTAQAWAGSGGYYKLRAKVIIPSDPGYFHAIESSNNNGFPLTGYPATGTFTVQLYWAAYNSSGAVQTGTFYNYTIVITNPPPSGNSGLKAEYFSGTTPLLNLVSSTESGTVPDNDWGNGAPTGLPADYFSVRWSGQVEATVTGTYQFTTGSDDGMRVFLNDSPTQLAGAWWDHGYLEASGEIYLVAGQRYPIKVEFFENSVGATAKLFWQPPGQQRVIVPMSQLLASPNGGNGGGGTPPSITTQPQGTTITAGTPITFSSQADGSAPLTFQWRMNASNIAGANGVSYAIANPQTSDSGTYDVVVTNAYGQATSSGAVLVVNSPPATGNGNGLLAEYYNGQSFNSLVTTRTDANVDFNWGSGAPVSGVNNDNFTVRWSGQVEAPVSGSYTFSTNADDGVRLKLNGTTIIDDWTMHPPMDRYASPVQLVAGTKYNITLEFLEAGGEAVARLYWEHPGQSRTVIPQVRLHSTPGSGGGSGGGGQTGWQNLITQTRSLYFQEGQDEEGNGNGNYGASDEIHSVSVPGSGTLRVYTTGSSDTRGDLYRSNWTHTGYSADNGGSGENFRFECPVSPGEHLVVVNGDYRWSDWAEYTLYVDFLPSGQADPGKATPTGTFAERVFPPSGNGTVYITAGMLNATFTHPSNPGAIQPNSNLITYTITSGFSPSAPTGSHPVGRYISPGYSPITITATYPGDSNYNAASVSAVFRIGTQYTPSAPSGIHHVLLGATSFSLAWDPCGNVPAGLPADFTYDISLDGGVTTYATVTYPLTAAIGNRMPSTAYSVVMRGRDQYGNTSSWSAPFSVTTQAEGASSTSGQQWMDLNNDGRLDQVFDAQGDTFEHFIYQTGYIRATYTEWIGYWIYVPGFNVGSGSSYSDGYGRNYPIAGDWMYYWEEDELDQDVPVVTPMFRFVADGGYDYKVGRLITRSNGSRILAPIYEASGIATGIHQWFPADPWGEAAYYTIPISLVRYSLAPGGCVMEIPGMGRVAAGGGASGSVTLPGGIKVSATGNGATVAIPGIGTIQVNSNGTWSGVATLPNGVTISTNSSGQAEITLPNGVVVKTGNGEVTLGTGNGIALKVGGAGGIRLDTPQGLGAIITNAVDELGKLLGNASNATNIRVRIGSGPWEPAGTGVIGNLPPGDHNVGVTNDTRGVPESQNVITITVRVLPSSGLQGAQYVVVSNGTDPDLASEVKVSLGSSATQAATVTFRAKGDGSLKFDPSVVSVPPGAERTVRVWGLTPSSAVNTTEIEAEFDYGEGRRNAHTSKLTAIEGVVFDFDGTFYSPVDTRNYIRRPHDGTPPRPGAFMASTIMGLPHADTLVPGALTQDGRDYSSSMVFSNGGQGVVRRTWSPIPRVTLKRILAVKPAIELTGDHLVGAEVHMTSGYFFEDLGNRNDLVKIPRLEIRQVGSDAAVSLTSSEETRLVVSPLYNSIPVKSRAAIVSELQAALNDPTKDKFAQWIVQTSSIETMAFNYEAFSTVGAAWDNTKFAAAKEAKIRDSIAAKALVGWQEKSGANKLRIHIEFKGFYEWELFGKVDNGSIATPP